MSPRAMTPAPEEFARARILRFAANDFAGFSGSRQRSATEVVFRTTKAALRFAIRKIAQVVDSVPQRVPTLSAASAPQRPHV